MTKIERLIGVNLRLISWIREHAKSQHTHTLVGLEDELLELLGSRGKTEMPKDFKLNDKMRDFAKAGGLDPELTMGHFKDYWLARGGQFKDWERAFRNWCRNAKTYKENRRA